MSKKEAMTLERYIRESCVGGKAKVRAYSRMDQDGNLYLRVEVQGLGRKPYAFRLEGDEIVTAAVEAKRAKRRAKRPVKSAAAQGIEQGVKEALA